MDERAPAFAQCGQTLVAGINKRKRVEEAVACNRRALRAEAASLYSLEKQRQAAAEAAAAANPAPPPAIHIRPAPALPRQPALIPSLGGSAVDCKQENHAGGLLGQLPSREQLQAAPRFGLNARELVLQAAGLLGGAAPDNPSAAAAASTLPDPGPSSPSSPHSPTVPGKTSPLRKGLPDPGPAAPPTTSAAAPPPPGAIPCLPPAARVSQASLTPPTAVGPPAAPSAAAMWAKRAGVALKPAAPAPAAAVVVRAASSLQFDDILGNSCGPRTGGKAAAASGVGRGRGQGQGQPGGRGGGPGSSAPTGSRGGGAARGARPAAHAGSQRVAAAQRQSAAAAPAALARVSAAEGGPGSGAGGGGRAGAPLADPSLLLACVPLPEQPFVPVVARSSIPRLQRQQACNSLAGSYLLLLLKLAAACAPEPAGSGGGAGRGSADGRLTQAAAEKSVRGDAELRKLASATALAHEAHLYR
ncbi:hypothetical protein V8C86DRAFT_2491443 [Haematococcus lacustris]